MKNVFKNAKWLGGIAALTIFGLVVYFIVAGQKTGIETSIDNYHTIGEDIFLSSDVQLNVIRSYESKGTDSERPRLQSVFTIARVRIINGSEDQFEVNPQDFSLIINGNSVAYKFLSYVFDPLPLRVLAPGEKVEGAVFWETPVKYRSKYIVYESATGDTIYINTAQN